MARLFYLSALIPLVMAFAAGCGNGLQTTSAPTGKTFTLAIGQTAQITGEDLSINFVEVTGDSRCPKNVVCVWEGEASSHIKITYRGVSYSMVLNEPGMAEQSQDIFIDYTLIYNLQPYPVAGQEIHPADYRLTLTITK